MRRILCIPFVLAVSGFILTQQGGAAQASALTTRVSQPATPENTTRAESPGKEIRPAALGPADKAADVQSPQRMPPPPPPPAPAPPKADHQVFTFVQSMPSFPGGEAALMRYLSEHVRYPASAREAGHQGTVVVQFNVERDGSLDHVVTEGLQRDRSLGTEAVRVVRGMPRWNPGRQDGRTVVVTYSLPIRFVLQ